MKQRKTIYVTKMFWCIIFFCLLFCFWMRENGNVGILKVTKTGFRTCMYIHIDRHRDDGNKRKNGKRNIKDTRLQPMIVADSVDFSYVLLGSSSNNSSGSNSHRRSLTDNHPFKSSPPSILSPHITVVYIFFCSFILFIGIVSNLP